MRALTVEELGFVSGGSPPPPRETEVVIVTATLPMRPSGWSGNLGGGTPVNWLTSSPDLQTKAWDLLNDPTLVVEDSETVGDDTMTTMKDGVGNTYQITDRLSDGFYDRIVKRSPTGVLSEWRSNFYSNRWTWQVIGQN